MWGCQETSAEIPGWVTEPTIHQDWHWENDLTFLHYMIEHWYFHLSLVTMVTAMDKGAFNTPQWGLVIITMYSYNNWCYPIALVTFDCFSDQTPDMRQLQGVRIYSGSHWGATVHHGKKGMEAKSEATGHIVSCPQWRSSTRNWAGRGNLKPPMTHFIQLGSTSRPICSWGLMCVHIHWTMGAFHIEMSTHII